MLVGVSEFARIKGVSAPTVSEACNGRIAAAVVQDGKRRLINVDQALELWDRKTRRNGSEKLSAKAVANDSRTLPSEQQIRDEVSGMPEDAIPGLDVSRERKEHYQAEIARLSALKERGELVPAVEVQKAAFALGRMIRDSLQVIPDRVAAQLAATADAREVHRLLSDEIAVALRGLANG